MHRRELRAQVLTHTYKYTIEESHDSCTLTASFTRQCPSPLPLPSSSPCLSHHGPDPPSSVSPATQTRGTQRLRIRKGVPGVVAGGKAAGPLLFSDNSTAVLIVHGSQKRTPVPVSMTRPELCAGRSASLCCGSVKGFALASSKNVYASDMTFAADGRLLQRLCPRAEMLCLTGTHEQLPLTALSDGAPVWLKTAGRQLEILTRFEVAGNCSLGLHVLASKLVRMRYRLAYRGPPARWCS